MSPLPHLTPALEDPSVEITVPARAEEILGIRRAIGAFAREAGVEEGRLADIVLAVGEACANAVVHAYPDGDPGPLRVTADLTPHGLQVVIADDGIGMRPRRDSPGLGLGLPLMASLTAAIEHRDSAAGGTEIWMVFPTEGPAASDAWARTG